MQGGSNQCTAVSTWPYNDLIQDSVSVVGRDERTPEVGTRTPSTAPEPSSRLTRPRNKRRSTLRRSPCACRNRPRSSTPLADPPETRILTMLRRTNADAAVAPTEMCKS